MVSSLAGSWKFSLPFMAGLCLLIAPPRKADILVEYGVVASNLKLCKAIGWTDKSREGIAAAYNVCIKELEAINKHDIQSRNAIVDKYCKAIEHLCNDATKKHAINGKFASKGLFALASSVVVAELELDEQTASQLSKLLQNGNEKLVAIYTNRVASGKFVSYKEFVDLFDDVVRQFENEVIAAIKDRMPVVYAKLIDRIDYARNSSYDEKYWSIRSPLLLKVQMEFAAKGIRFDRQPLLLNMTQVVMVSLPAFRDLMKITEEELTAVSELYSQLIVRYHEVVLLYNQVDTNETQKIAGAFSFFRKIMIDDFNRFDQLLTSRVPDRIVRIKEIKKQYSGINAIFNLGDEGRRYGLTVDQRKLYADINRRLYQSSPQTKLSLEARAKRLLAKEKELYSKVFTENQRMQWDAEVGEKIGDESFIRLYVQFQELQQATTAKAK